VRGQREEELLDATVAELAAVGYDRLTMDAVAARAHASKATLYRRWPSKQAMVVDAVIRSKRADADPPDTGSLRGDLLALFCGPQAREGQRSDRILAALVTALQVDTTLAVEFRTRFLAPKLESGREVYRRAAARGELLPSADPALLAPALAGILLHREFVLGEQVTPTLVARVVDEVILPAATGRHGSPAPVPQELS
jgi:AcrR family transcriptional regulator